MAEATSHLGKLSAIVAAVVAAYAMVMVAACTCWKVRRFERILAYIFGDTFY